MITIPIYMNPSTVINIKAGMFKPGQTVKDANY